MHLISPLASGIAGASNGSAEIYVRGTTQRATRYLDFEATQAVTPTAALPLDSNGSAVVYVNQMVDVVVSSESGIEIRRFVAGYGAPGIEVISQSITGTDYSSGQSSASKPTTLQVALDALKTSFGALDFNVLFNGSSRTLQSALATVGGFAFNVKDPVYGAVGNGVADDTSAIRAAVTACNAAGGGIVFFPPGTYSHTGLSLTSKVSLMGAGPAASILSLKHASNSAVSWSAVTASDRPAIEGLRFTLGQNNSGHTLDIATAGLNLKVDNCVFDAGSFDASGIFIYEHVGATCGLWITRCKFLNSANTQRCVYATNCQAYVALCEFTAVTSSVGLIQLTFSMGACIGNTFDTSAATSGSVTPIIAFAASSGATAAIGNRVTASGGATVIVSVTNAVELGNSLPDTVTLNQAISVDTATKNLGVALGVERTIRRATITGTTAVYTCPDDCGELILDMQSSVDLALTLPTPCVGRHGRVIFINNTGGAKNVHPLPAGGITARGGGSGIVSVGAGNCYVVIWEYFRSASAVRLLIEQANSGSQFSL